jgi:hypothetical protein
MITRTTIENLKRWLDADDGRMMAVLDQIDDQGHEDIQRACEQIFSKMNEEARGQMDREQITLGIITAMTIGLIAGAEYHDYAMLDPISYAPPEPIQIIPPSRLEIATRVVAGISSGRPDYPPVPLVRRAYLITDELLRQGETEPEDV